MSPHAYLGSIMFLACAVHAAPVYAQHVAVYVMIPAGTGYRIVRIEKDQPQEVASTSYVKSYGYRPNEMVAIEASKLLVFKPSDARPSGAALRDPNVVEYVSGPERQVFFHNDAAYFITIMAGKGAPKYVLNEAKGVPPTLSQFQIPETIRGSLMVPVPDGLIVYSAVGNKSATLFSYANKDFTSIVDGKSTAGGPQHSWRILFIPTQGLWRVSLDGLVERVTDTSLKPVSETASYSMDLGGVIKKAVATSVRGTPVALMGLGGEHGDITRLVFYNLKEKKALDDKKLDFEAVTFSVPDSGGMVYLVNRTRRSIDEYDLGRGTVTKIMDLAKDVNIRDVRICPVVLQ
jgi:hypothetical protein